MEEFDRPLEATIQEYEDDHYTVFMEAWDLFESEREDLFIAFEDLDKGIADKTFAEAVESVNEKCDNLENALDDLLYRLYEICPENEAKRICAYILDEDQKLRFGAMKSVKEDAGFVLTKQEELEDIARMYAIEHGDEDSATNYIFEKLVNAIDDQIDDFLDLFSPETYKGKS